MGDHRVGIKIEFDAHGKKYETDMSINYFDNGDGIDQRIVDWFRDCWGDAFSRYQNSVAEHFRKEHAAEIEAQERAALAELKAKYEPAPQETQP